MDAYQRRWNIFLEELETDIVKLETDIKNEKFEKVRKLAHKYKMRLSYFKQEAALEQCKKIVTAFDAGDMKSTKTESEAWKTILNDILNKSNK